jgi:DNA-binding GntR family transcriptional regulator
MYRAASPLRAKKKSTVLRMPKPSAKANVDDSEGSSSDRVVEYVTSGLLAGRLVPGQRLIEADLTLSLRVSRGPVREAFRRLDALGIIVGAMHRGACIRSLSRSEALELLVALEPLEILMVRSAARQIASRSQASEVSPYADELRRYRDKDRDLEITPDRRKRFTDLLIALSGNSQLPSIYPTMRLHVLRLQTNSFEVPGSPRINIEDYADIARAVLRGDEDQAERAMTRHNQRMQERIKHLPDEAFPVTGP